MRINPKITFSGVVIVVVSPTIFSVLGCNYWGWDVNKVAPALIVSYMSCIFLALIMWGVWSVLFEDAYEKWKEQHQEEVFKKSWQDKEIARLQAEVKELRQKLEDRWDNF